MNWTTGFMQRVLFNASKAYVRQLDKNENYKILQPVYALNLLNENYNNNPSYYHHYQIVETGSPEEKIEGLEFVFVELQKFEAKNISDKKLQVLWLRFLTEINEQTTEIPDELLEAEEIKEATDKLQANSFTKAQLEYYNRYWDKVRRERTLKEESFDKGKLEGAKEGELRKQIEIAKNFMNKGIDLEIIANTTGLTVTEIKNL